MIRNNPHDVSSHFLKMCFLLFFLHANASHVQTHTAWPSGRWRHRHSSHVQRRMHPLLPSADIAKVSSALILFDFIHAKVISDSRNGGGGGCGGSPGRKAMVDSGQHCVCVVLPFWMHESLVRDRYSQWRMSETTWPQRSLPVPGKWLLSLCFHKNRRRKAAVVKKEPPHVT